MIAQLIKNQIGQYELFIGAHNGLDYTYATYEDFDTALSKSLKYFKRVEYKGRIYNDTILRKLKIDKINDTKK